jgi:hypothetical protein
MGVAVWEKFSSIVGVLLEEQGCCISKQIVNEAEINKREANEYEMEHTECRSQSKHEGGGGSAISQKCKTRHLSSRHHGADLTITKERLIERE